MELDDTNRSRAWFRREVRETDWKKAKEVQIKEMLCSCQGVREKDKFTISGDDGEGVPPVPIPNTEVKPFSADGTWLDTARESRTLPESR